MFYQYELYFTRNHKKQLLFIAFYKFNFFSRKNNIYFLILYYSYQVSRTKNYIIIQNPKHLRNDC